MGVKKGEANMTRKASGTEKKKLSKRDEHMLALEQADAEAPQLSEYAEVLDELVAQEGIAGTFEELAIEYASLTAQEYDAGKRKDQLKPVFKKLLPLVGADKIAGDTVVVELVTGHTPRQLSATKLLATGKLTIDEINACYEGGVEYKYASIRMRRPKDYQP